MSVLWLHELAAPMPTEQVLCRVCTFIHGPRNQGMIQVMKLTPAPTALDWPVTSNLELCTGVP